MSGFIHYDERSPMSTRYPRSFTMNNHVYLSVYDAIQSGEDTFEAILQMISDNRDLFYPYRHYIFQGEYDTYINDAINLLFIPKKEDVSIGSYIYIFNRDIFLPEKYGIPISRDVYLLEHINGNIYMQKNILPLTETYQVYLIYDTPLYIGKNGSFLLLKDKDQDISIIQESI